MNRDREIIRMYEAGMTAPDISRSLLCGSSTVYRVLDEAGIRRRTSGRRRFSPRVEAQIVRGYNHGESYEALARKFGCSTYVIGRLVHATSRPRAAGGQKPLALKKNEVRSAIARYKRGESQQQIADDYGVSQSVISRVLRRSGIETRRVPSRHASWKGGRSLNADGYMLVLVRPDDPFAEMRNAAGYVLEHRLVMARKLGRPLGKDETVHHKNGNRADNRVTNLELRIGRHGKGSTHAHCPTCTCFGVHA